MKLLLYCICEAQAEVAAPAAGVRGAAVQKLVADGLRCFYSELREFGGDAATAQKDALDFYAVTRAVFKQAAIVAFRFPSVMAEVREIASFLEGHASLYQADLQRLRDAVQMEVRLTLAEHRNNPVSPGSGTQYLQARAEGQRKLADASRACREALDEVARQYEPWWRARPLDDTLRCFALVPRSATWEVEQRLGGLHLEGVQAIVSGPWPVTEFFEFPKYE